MKYKSNSKIVGMGAYVPNRKLTNSDLEKMIETTDEWILKRTGVKERRISGKNEFSSDLAIKAVENLIESQNVKIDDVDMIIVTTFTPDHLTPTVSAIVQGHFGIKNAGTMDISAGCTAFEYAFTTADSLISSGNFNKILIISAETVSKVVDYTDRSSCILFGDAAVATLVERTENNGNLICSYFDTDGILAENVSCSCLSNNINSQLLNKERLFDQNGKFVYEYVVKNVPDGINNLLKKAELTLNDIDWFVPHSANLRIIEAISKRLDYPTEKVLSSIEHYGNTSSASIPLAIWLALQESKIKSGDKMVLYGFGGGLTHGGVVIEW